MAHRKVGAVRLVLSRGTDPASVEDRRHVKRPRGSRGRGQSLVEFALVAPILLLLVGGAVQYAAIQATKHSLIQVARDTARWAGLPSGSPLGYVGSNSRFCQIIAQVASSF